ncbi:carbohydrate-binding module family 18 protein, partial [Piromyces sp. E2]
PISTVEDRCGPSYGRCAHTNECCSQYGWCGTSTDHCGTGCQSEFGQCSGTANKITNAVVKKTTTVTAIKKTNIPVSTVSGKCGPSYGRCAHTNECCSQYGWCGTSTDHCGMGCQSEFGQCSGATAIKKTNTVAAVKKTTTKSTSIPISTVEYRCGPSFGRCANKNECCSQYGWCGTTTDHCKVGCQSSYGIC